MPAVELVPHIALLCNPRAGKGKALALSRRIMGKLAGENRSFSFFSDRWPEHFDDFSSVWLVGGDGTVHYFVNRYPLLTIPVALFKGGSGNDFAWKLYGDISPGEYLDLALQGNGKPVDVGICNKKYFINGVGIGFDGDVVKSMGKRKLLTAGYLSYLVVVLKNIFFFKEREMVIEVDGVVKCGRWFMLSVANGSRYGGGFLVAPQADPVDGWFDVVLMKPISRLKRLIYLPRMKKGRHLLLSFVEMVRAKHVVVNAGEVVPAHLDGELMETTQFEIRFSPQTMLFIY
ncbi:MAG TPA: diacylglycerol kinase family protein [Puia sp.]|nr:diacylglycerol kinase family protein [Puia sp.]